MTRHVCSRFGMPTSQRRGERRPKSSPDVSRGCTRGDMSASEDARGQVSDRETGPSEVAPRGLSDAPCQFRLGTPARFEPATPALGVRSALIQVGAYLVHVVAVCRHRPRLLWAAWMPAEQLRHRADLQRLVRPVGPGATRHADRYTSMASGRSAGHHPPAERERSRRISWAGCTIVPKKLGRGLVLGPVCFPPVAIPHR
jgi:hypothetical protein